MSSPSVSVGSRHPADGLARNLQRGPARVDAARRGERAGTQAPRGLRVEIFVGGPLRSPGERGCALDLGDQGAEAQEDVLVAGELLDAAALEQLGQGVVSERGDVGADLRVQGAESLELARLRVVVVAARLQVLLPAAAGNRDLHDLRGALVDRRDTDVALDLLDHVVVGVAVAAVGLDRRIRGGVARLGGQVLGDRALDVELSLTGVDPLGGLLDRRPRCLERNRVGDDQLVRVALLLRKRTARPGPACASTGSRGRAPPNRRRARTRPPSGACSRILAGPGRGPGPRRRRSAGRRRRGPCRGTALPCY